MDIANQEVSRISNEIKPVKPSPAPPNGQCKDAYKAYTKAVNDVNFAAKQAKTVEDWITQVGKDLNSTFSTISDDFRDLVDSLRNIVNQGNPNNTYGLPNPNTGNILAADLDRDTGNVSKATTNDGFVSSMTQLNRDLNSTATYAASFYTSQSNVKSIAVPTIARVIQALSDRVGGLDKILLQKSKDLHDDLQLLHSIENQWLTLNNKLNKAQNALKRCMCNGTSNGSAAAALDTPLVSAAASMSNQCSLPPPNPPGKGGGGGGGSSQAPHDPNNIIGPAGFGDQGFVSAEQLLPYQIDFENELTAGLPAQQVTITQQLDANLNWQSFRLGSFGFGGTTYTVPANTAFYQTKIDLTQTNGFFVDVTGTIDERTGIATWTFTTIDPATGQIPLDPRIGFLPPDIANGIGEGFVSYTVEASPADPTGTVINAQATVMFYTQPPIDTPQIFNTIDSGAGLTSTVAPLPANERSDQFNVSWSGTDANNGSAISGFNIYVTDNGGPFTPWLQDTTLRSATYVGQDGHTYGFYSVATDNVGNIEATTSSAQASRPLSESLS